VSGRKQRYTEGTDLLGDTETKGFFFSSRTDKGGVSKKHDAFRGVYRNA